MRVIHTFLWTIKKNLGHTLFLCSLALAGCGIPKNPNNPEEVILDPFEDVNRLIFSFNRYLDDYLLFPYLTAYYTFFPPFMIKSINNVLENISETTSIVNAFLQFKGDALLVHTARLLLNTTFGVVGIFDVATELGLKAKPETFTDTFKKVAHMPPGFYFVLPVLGPATARSLLDLAADYSIPFPPSRPSWIKSMYYALDYSNVRLTYMELQKHLYNTSSDPYAAVRRSYYEAYDDLPTVPSSNQAKETMEEDLFSDAESTQETMKSLEKPKKKAAQSPLQHKDPEDGEDPTEEEGRVPGIEEDAFFE
jgi:phospholipid-binding lipoprotein MlaA